MSTSIEFRHICKSYGDKAVLDNFNLSIEAGEFVTIIGSSGCGKTTALKLVNGLLTPDSGAVLINGEDIAGMDQVQLRRNIGYAIQGSVLFPHMSVEQNIAYVPNLLNRRDKKRTREAVDKWMRIVGLDGELKRRYPDAAGIAGENPNTVGYSAFRMAAAGFLIPFMFITSPELLLMDEPFGAVDEITRAQLQTELKRIWQQTGITVLFVTHDISEALRLGTKVLVMDAGKIEQYAPPKELLRAPATDFVRRLVERERRACRLPDAQLAGCEFSGAAARGQ